MEESKIKETFAIWETKLGVPKEQLYGEFQANMKALGQTYTGEILLARAFQMMRGAYSKQFNSKAKAFECVIIGLGQAYDKFKKVRKDSMDKGFLNDAGQPIFTDYKWREGKVIPGPDSPESKQMRVYGVFKESTQDSWKPGMMFYDGANVSTDILFAKSSVRGGIKDEALSEPVLQINSTNVTKFIKTEEAKNVEQMFASLMPQNCIALENIENANPDELPLNIVVTKGTVINVNITEEGKSNVLELARPINSLADIDLSAVGPDETPNYTIWMPESIDLSKIGPGSEVLLVTQISKGADAEGNPRTNYNGLGVHVLNGVLPEIKDIPQPATEKPEVEIITPTQSPAQGDDVPW